MIESGQRNPGRQIISHSAPSVGFDGRDRPDSIVWPIIFKSAVGSPQLWAVALE